MNITETLGEAADRMASMRFKVLVADDSAADQLLAQRRLGRSCCLELVGTVKSGGEAIDYLLGKGNYTDRSIYPFPDLLMLDVDMPGIDGLEVLSWLRKQNFPSLRVVMLSGSMDPAAAARSLALGADYFQTKNTHPAELNYFIRRIEFLMVLLANREPPAPLQEQFMKEPVVNKILTVVDGRAPLWKEDILRASDTGHNFVLVLESESDLQKLWSTLGTTNIVPDRLQRWGLLALSEALTTEDFDSLQVSCKNDFVYLIEQITLNRNVPPRTKRYLLYCEIRGMISHHDTVEEAGMSLINYLAGFKLARLLPLAGIYEHGNGKWERVKKLTT